MLAWLHFVNAISKSLMDTIDEFYLKRVFLLNNGKQAQRIRPHTEVSRERGYSQRMLNTQAPESDNTGVGILSPSNY